MLALTGGSKEETEEDGGQGSEDEADQAVLASQGIQDRGESRHPTQPCSTLQRQKDIVASFFVSDDEVLSCHTGPSHSLHALHGSVGRVRATTLPTTLKMTPTTVVATRSRF